MDKKTFYYAGLSSETSAGDFRIHRNKLFVRKNANFERELYTRKRICIVLGIGQQLVSIFDVFEMSFRNSLKSFYFSTDFQIIFTVLNFQILHFYSMFLFIDDNHDHESRPCLPNTFVMFTFELDFKFAKQHPNWTIYTNEKSNLIENIQGYP